MRDDWSVRGVRLARAFAERLGMGEETLRLRLRSSNPTPFRLPEVYRLCREFGVRPDFVLLGDGPMLRTDVESATGPSTRTFAEELFARLVVATSTRTESDEASVAEALGDPAGLLADIENGVTEAFVSIIDLHASDRLLARKTVRDAVQRIVSKSVIDPVPDSYFSEAIRASSTLRPSSTASPRKRSKAKKKRRA